MDSEDIFKILFECLINYTNLYLFSKYEAFKAWNKIGLIDVFNGFNFLKY